MKRKHVKKVLDKTSQQLHYYVRLARQEDITHMVGIDLAAFVKVYDGYNQSTDQLREELTQKFTRRFELLGPTWMPLVCRQHSNGKEQVMGFMHCCPTNKEPDEFVSWEKTTNHGWLDGLYEQKGKNLYVVTLSVDPQFSGRHVQDVMFMQQIGTFLAHGMHCAYFESRMPGFRKWVMTQTGQDERSVDDMPKSAVAKYAEQYFHERLARVDPRTGKIRHRHVDPLLRLYESAGCRLERLVANAYQDKPSMNYGVVCTFRHPFRNKRTNRPSWIGKQIGQRFIGPLAKWAAQHPEIAQRFF